MTTFNTLRNLSAVLVFVALFLLPAPRVVYSQTTYIRNVFITNSPTHLQLQFQLHNSLSSKMKEAIQTGIPTVFDYYIELHQSRSFWDDRQLASIVITRTIKFDTLKQEYVLTEQTTVDGASTEVVSTIDEAMEFMNNVKIRSFYPIWKLERNKAYYFRIRARSKGIAPPRYMHYLLFFMNWMNFDTEWIVERFYY